ncbi:MAG: aspartate--tRNA ligase [Acidimicrobiales bacterium]
MTMRTHYCGTLRTTDSGQNVSVCGWVAHRREHGEHLAFVDLRDHTGIVQCVVPGSLEARPEWVLRVTGTVAARPEGTVNADLATGTVEIRDCEVEVLSQAEPPPFQLDERVAIDEIARLRYRYVDLRRDRMQRNLRLRARVNSAIRAAMEGQGFVEVETPMLIAATPEGARDFLVPSRLQPGSVYALPQSPQILKQLLMVGGVDRYYQLARCMRDEDLRADRQFEFTQLDAEMSFCSQDDVLEAISVAVAAAARAATGAEVDPHSIPRMTWEEAQERYGSDKPDVRFGMELVEVTPRFASTGFKVFQAPCVKAICVPGAGDLGRGRLDALTDSAKRWGAGGLVWMRVRTGGDLESPVAKFLSDDEKAALVADTGAAPGDLILLVADLRPVVRHVLGLLRLELGRPPVNEGGLHFLWVTEFPLFESLDEGGRPVPAHHPFTMPVEADYGILESDPLAVRSQAYDLVLNGWELGSGSVRIHRNDIQGRIFALLGIEAEEAQRRFGFLLDAFRYGAPPHAGFAFGVDRLVALLAGEENIREVIAYPKTQSGLDPLMGAPAPVSDAELSVLGLRLLPPPAKG